VDRLALKKLGLFGGRFDPVHHGHLQAARTALTDASLVGVIFVPAGRICGHGRPTVGAPAHRLAMLRRAIADTPQFAISEIEVWAETPRYTVDTVAQLQREHPVHQLCWILGQDQLRGIEGWRGIDRLAAMVDFIVVDRAGMSRPPGPSLPGVRVHACMAPPLAHSSSDLRMRMQNHEPIEGWTPAAVADYIRACGVYPGVGPAGA
jgi:nicotinate-nucleotide adenylyltransferase